MKDFSDFFVKEKSAIDGCFVCKSSSTTALPGDGAF
jgi:hypothetical protein